METNLNSLKKTGRLAGLLYLIWAISGIYGMIYLPAQYIVRGDTVSTANKILSNEFLFRTGIINDLICSAIAVFLIVALYRLFKQVNERQAIYMVSLLVVTFPVAFIMDAFSITSLMILKGEVLKTFELSQRQDVAMFFLKINDYGGLALEMFWGLWLFPLAILVYKSNFLPRLLGIWLFINGFAYVVMSFTALLFPPYADIVTKIAYPALFGEIAFALWLLIKGIKVPEMKTSN